MRVGSKAFTESVILGEMLRLLARDAGIETAHYRSLGGTPVVFRALTTGEIDAYPEYTGTIVKEIFDGEDLPDAEAIRAALKRHDVGMSKPLGFKNNYAMVMTSKRAKELGITRLSDLKRFPELRFAFNHEFLDRGDGWPGLKKHYDLPQRDVSGIDHDLAYQRLLAGEIDMLDGYSTDAMIERGNLRVLEDDLSFFPDYDAVWLYRLDLKSRYPEFLAALTGIEGTINEETMRSLNEVVESRDQNEAQAAADFLGEQSGHKVAAAATSSYGMILRHVAEHLNLVRQSLLPAIVVGAAIGIACQRWPRPGKFVLAGVGLLQTIPSLALLVLLMPVVAALGYRSVGEGSMTAVVALFCYCLLPIVSNTFTGIHGIQRGTIESATVLGLGPASRLAEIELPIALPTMLAGIRTAGVQNVGFATLGAIIGAGGLGQPILRGIRLDDFKLILAGAIPAALLALALQLSIDLFERLVVPRGLKRQPAARD
ncbi:MAG: ABC transporter permease subunit [Planctomycetota bacterium]|nr:MAG: ABC transporter permease subunit [Planctomycetota bacterium]